MKKSFVSLMTVCLCMLVAAAQPAYARRPAPSKPVQVKPAAPKPLTMKLVLAPSSMLPELQGAWGRLDYRSKKRNTQFKVDVMIPGLPASLSILDLTSARMLDLHIELNRQGVVYNDCFFKFSGEDDIEMPDGSAIPVWKYKLFVKSTGRSAVQGQCGNGVPSMEPGDAVAVYAVVGGVRVNLLAK